MYHGLVSLSFQGEEEEKEEIEEGVKEEVEEGVEGLRVPLGV